MSTTAENLLDNSDPINPSDEKYKALFENLQGNILKGHGRDFSVNIFLEFNLTGTDLRKKIKGLSEYYVTSAAKQVEESDTFKRFKIPGSLFGNLFLSANAYKKLGFTDQLENWFDDKDPVVATLPDELKPLFPLNSTFVKGMRTASADLGDIPENLENIDLTKVETLSPIQKHFLFTKGKIENDVELEPLEKAYFEEKIDAMLLLADDSEEYLLRKTRELIINIEKKGTATVIAVELGKALRNQDGEGIEHFGYVDGRSQPLFLAEDFKNLQNDAIDITKTTERINEKALRRESGAIDIWNPFEKLSLVLRSDPAVNDASAFGSYFVFRKLEQDVMRFSIAEQQLADTLKLTGSDRERAGAMAVGRFRDGTPLVLSETDGLIPAKANNFRYDGLDATLTANPLSVNDSEGLKCPFQAHIRKTSPRQQSDPLLEKGDRERRIIRRGIPYGDRNREPNAFQALDDLPTGDVGLLFACFQKSIAIQYAFMQKTWVNNVGFKVPSTGLDPLIGQALSVDGTENPPQNWRKEFGGEPTPGSTFPANHPTKSSFSDFIKFRGGEFFFAPSMAFLLAKDPLIVAEKLVKVSTD